MTLDEDDSARQDSFSLLPFYEGLVKLFNPKFSVQLSSFPAGWSGQWLNRTGQELIRGTDKFSTKLDPPAKNIHLLV